MLAFLSSMVILINNEIREFVRSEDFNHRCRECRPKIFYCRIPILQVIKKEHPVLFSFQNHNVLDCVKRISWYLEFSRRALSMNILKNSDINIAESEEKWYKIIIKLKICLFVMQH